MADKSISHAISGGLSGLVSMAVTYPLVTLSTNAQAKVNVGEGLLKKLGSYKEEETEVTPTDAKQKIKLILTKLLNRLKFFLQNSKKFYAGLESALIGIVAVNFTYYYVYNIVGNYFKRANRLNNGLNVKNSLITGLTAGIVSRVITNPIWVANTRMTVKKNGTTESETETGTEANAKNPNTFQVMKDILKTEGVKGLFSGIGPALVLVLSPMVQFTVYEQMKNLIVKLRHNRDISSFEALLLGSFGKLIAILATYPYYTVRSRMHLKMSGEDDNGLKVLIDIAKKDGILSLYNGMNAKLLQSVLSAGLIFYFKEEMMSVVGRSVIQCTRTGGDVSKLIQSINFKKLVSRR